MSWYVDPSRFSDKFIVNYIDKEYNELDLECMMCNTSFIFSETDNYLEDKTGLLRPICPSCHNN